VSRCIGELIWPPRDGRCTAWLFASKCPYYLLEIPGYNHHKKVSLRWIS